MRGNETQDPNNPFFANVWSLQGLTLATADASIFSIDDFTKNRDAGVKGFGDEHVVTASLTESRLIEIDLSSVSVGAEFYVVSSAMAHARNSYSAEGGAVAYLRDPAAFEPGDKPGGVSFVKIPRVWYYVSLVTGVVPVADQGSGFCRSPSARDSNLIANRQSAKDCILIPGNDYRSRP